METLKCKRVDLFLCIFLAALLGLTGCGSGEAITPLPLPPTATFTKTPLSPTPTPTEEQTSEKNAEGHQLDVGNRREEVSEDYAQDDEQRGEYQFPGGAPRNHRYAPVPHLAVLA